MKHSLRCLFGWDAFSNSWPGRCGRIIWTALLLLAASASVGMIALYFGAVKYPEMFSTYFHISMLPELNILPVILLAFLFWFLTGSAGLGLAVPTVTVMALTMINVLKIRLRNDPLMMEDLKLASEAGGIAGNYNLSLDQEKWMGIGCAIVLILLVAFLTRRSYLGIRKGWGWFRLVCSILMLIVCAVIWNKVYMNEDIYSATINNECGINHYSNVDEFQSRGFVYPFLYSYKKAIDTAPDGYDKKQAQQVLDSYTDAEIAQDKKVNIISVMLESYSDLSGLIDNEAIEQVYAPLREIQSESISGNLIADIFMGGTIQTERSFLTGYSHLGSFRSATNSYVRYLASQGYTVEGSHPGYEWFYNRSNVNANLGFTQYRFFENYYEEAGFREKTLTIDSDVKLFPELVSQMKDSIAQTGQPYFSFSVTYQNHGPYTSELLLRDVPAYVTPDETGWSDESCMILNNYLSGIADTTAQIQAALEELEDYEEPVVFVAFGDHLPWLGDDNSVYNEVGMDIAIDTAQGFRNHFSTPYFIWANSAAKELLGNDFVGEGDEISPCFLMSEVFDQLGWEGDSYMQYTRTVRDVCPVLSENGVYKVDGELTWELSDDMQAIVDQFQSVQYYRRRNFEESK